ncbi:MAG: sulfatase-like hydrolase/transferase [Bdellovibrionia bacterium]
MFRVQMSLKIALSFLPCLLLISCSNTHDVEFGKIRKAPDLGEMQHFVESNGFSAKTRPNIYFLFFDTLRPDLALSQKGAIQKFYNDSLTFETAYASGTATWYSMFSFFHGLPSFITYDAVPRAQSHTNHYGSLFFKVLNQIGYKLNTYGFAWECDVEERPSGTSWKRFLTTFFGWKTRLLDRCATDPHYDDRFGVNRDEITIENLESKLPQTIQSAEGHLSFIALYNNHDPYKWGSLVSGARKNIGFREDFSNMKTTVNRYMNSVMASDINFERLLKLVRSLPGNENAVIVLFSDHGESLYEKNRESAHGGIPYKERAEILLAMQLGADPALRIDLRNSIASIMDIFPTLFDYMGVKPEIPSSLITGKSLLRETRDSTIVIRTNKESPTREMVMVNRDSKAWIKVEEDDFYHSRSFSLIKITDLDDLKIGNFCEGRTSEKCREELLNRFPDALMELYPDLSINKGISHE